MEYGKYTGSSKTLVGDDLFLPFTVVEVVNDCALLSQLGEDISKDKNHFLINE
jgi:hypothetical protein